MRPSDVPRESAPTESPRWTEPGGAPILPSGEATGSGGYGVARPQPEYGGRWRRLLAAIIDALAVYLVIWVVTVPLVGLSTIYDGENIARRTAADVIAAVIGFLYYMLQHGRWGRTLGKRAMSLLVVREEDGDAISYGRAAWRLLFSYLLSLLTFGIGNLVDVAWILWDRRRQALHDKVARTVVLRDSPGLPDPYARPAGGLPA
jgi:uncharacterized RDD family membrane protein YckC